MRYAIGIDLGGTKIEGILMDEKGKVLKNYRMPTQAHRPLKVILNNIITVVEKLKDKPIQGVGIGVPGVVLPNGKLVDIPNIKPLKNLNIAKVLEKKLKTKVFAENDANCFALAEHRLGAGKGTKNMLGVTIGTGIGGGIILNGKLYRGYVGAAGEFGHQVINPQGPKYGILKGEFESWCSGPNIVKRYKKQGGKSDFTSPAHIFQSKEKIAKQVMKETYKYLGIGLGNLVNILNPDLIVLGGGVSNLPFYREVNITTKEFSMPCLRKKIKVVKNKLGDSAGKIGAAALVFQE